MSSIIEGQHSIHEPLMHKIFEERSKLNENWICRPAVYFHDQVDGVRETSYDELNKNANRLGTCIVEILHRNNATRNGDGDYVIAVCMNTNDNVIATLLAIWKSGAAYLPLETNFPINRIEHIVGEARPALVIYDDNVDRSVFGDVLSISYKELLTKSRNCSECNILTPNSVSRCEDDVAIILYTSGSTGLPKGVRLPHSAILNKLRWFEATFPYSSTEKVAPLNSALINVDSVAELWCPLLNGVAVLVIPPEVTRDPSKLVDLLESYKVERLVLVPTLLTSILAYLSLRNERVLSNLKTWICCGETLTTALAGKFFANFHGGSNRLCNFYGSTEDMGDVTYYVCHNADQLAGLSKVPIGCAIANTIIYILNDDLNNVKPGEIGEIFASGMGLAKGYVAGREKTKFIHNRFNDDPKFNRLYRTGDFGKLIDERCIQYEGRADSQVKVRGNRVEILEIEKVLRTLDDVDKGVVLCYHAGKIDQAILAFVVLKTDIDGSSVEQGNAIENILRTKLRDFELPHVFVLKSIPLLPNGKVDRQTLLKFYESVNEKSNIEYDLTGLPENRIETAKEVFKIIGNVIGSSIRGAISARSNFYELGGNSLNSVLTVTQLRSKGFSIGVTDFIAAKCLGDVIDKICGTEKIDENVRKFKTFPLAMHHKNAVIEIMTTSFHAKSDLLVHLDQETNQNDQRDYIEAIWEDLLQQNLSFVVVDNDGNIVGISLNQDGHDQPVLMLDSYHFRTVFGFLDSIEKPFLEKHLPQGKTKVLKNAITATSAELTPQENIEIVQIMEEVNFDVAKRKGFIGMLALNTNLLTQQLGSDIYGYETLYDCQINQYVDGNGLRPFGKAPDSQRVLLHWKTIS